MDAVAIEFVADTPETLKPGALASVNLSGFTFMRDRSKAVQCAGRGSRGLARELFEHEPASSIKRQIVQKMAPDQWKQMRIWAMQVGGHAGEIRNREVNHFDILSRDIAYRAYVAYKESHGDRRCTEPLHRYEVPYLRHYHFS